MADIKGKPEVTGILAVALCAALCGCGNTKTIGGVTYDAFGLANEADKRNPSIEYRISPGSAAAAILLSETIVVPAYVVLFDIYEPVGFKDSGLPKGAVSERVVSPTNCS